MGRCSIEIMLISVFETSESFIIEPLDRSVLELDSRRAEVLEFGLLKVEGEAREEFF